MILSLEYIRQMMNMDDLCFVSRKQKEQIGPFIINSKALAKEVDNLLNQMKFKLSITW